MSARAASGVDLPVARRRACVGASTRRALHHAALVAGAVMCVFVSGVAAAADYRSVSDPAVILFDAPSQKARPLFILGRDTPLEVIVTVEGWVKVKDADGTFGWVERKALSDRRTLLARAPFAEVRASADEKAALVFRAEPGVVLELGEPITSVAAASVPGWVRVKHQDGQSGFVRITQVFGL
jgi:SH3-like domain-containing protein